jgi:hypothetical protein
LQLASASGLIQEKYPAFAKQKQLFLYLTALAKALRMNDLIISFG